MEKINRDEVINNFKKFLLEKNNKKIKMEYEDILSKNMINEDKLSKNMINEDKIKNIINNCKYVEKLCSTWYDNNANIYITVHYENVIKNEVLTIYEYRKIKSFYHKEIYDENNYKVQIFFLKI